MRTRLSVSVCMRGKKAYLSESEDGPGLRMTEKKIGLERWREILREIIGSRSK